VLGNEKAKIQLTLIAKAKAIDAAVQEQIAAYNKIPCPANPEGKGIGLLPEIGISVVLPQSLPP
jgi:hypothetical protein